MRGIFSLYQGICDYNLLRTKIDMGNSDLDEVLDISYLIKSMQENDVESDNYQLPVVAKRRSRFVGITNYKTNALKSS